MMLYGVRLFVLVVCACDVWRDDVRFDFTC